MLYPGGVIICQECLLISSFQQYMYHGLRSSIRASAISSLTFQLSKKKRNVVTCFTLKKDARIQRHVSQFSLIFYTKFYTLERKRYEQVTYYSLLAIKKARRFWSRYDSVVCRQRSDSKHISKTVI